MSTVEINIYQTQEVEDEHPDLNHEIADLVRDTLSQWGDVTGFVSVDAPTPVAPSQEVTTSGSGYICLNTYATWDDLLEWWRQYCNNTDCISNTAADSNLLITNGPGDAPSGRAGIGGQFAVVEHGPLINGDWYYSGTRDSNDYQYRYAMNAVHEIGHNLGLRHEDGRVDNNAQGDVDETPMTNFYGDEAINNNWNLTCDCCVPSSTPSDYYTLNGFSDCEKNNSYL